jgi:hypothetical protein
MRPDRNRYPSCSGPGETCTPFSACARRFVHAGTAMLRKYS